MSPDVIDLTRLIAMILSLIATLEYATWASCAAGALY